MTVPSATKFKVADLSVAIYSTTAAMAQAAAQAAADQLSQAISERGEAAAILATGNSQIDFLKALVEGQGTSWNLDWAKITLFHMDEYLGLPETHSASFRLYMKEKVEKLLKPKAFHYIEGDALEPIRECDRYSNLLATRPIDLCCLGIGENGHLAFNDPPVADFDDLRFVKIVRLEESCRMQQVGEGHFPNLEAVPQYALTLTIPALCSAKKMLAIVPEKRKAQAVANTLLGIINLQCPATYLRTQSHCELFLDGDSASLLPDTAIAAWA